MLDINQKFVFSVDAASRIAINLINQVNSPQIARFGDLSHNPLGGFISGDGNTAISVDARLISRREWHPVTILNGNFQGTVWQFCERLYSCTPHLLPGLLEMLTGQSDLVYLARSLQLDRCNVDEFCCGCFVRSFADNLVMPPLGSIGLPIFDHLGTLLRMNVYYQDCVFELKAFKYTYCPGEYTFLFKPTHAGICSPITPVDGMPIVLTTDVKAVLTYTSAANTWLNDSGSLDELDWECFRGHPVQYLLDSPGCQSRDRFAQALAFIETAQKYGYDVQLRRDNSLLPRPEIVAMAEKHRLPLPASLKGLTYILTDRAAAASCPRGIPVFWGSGWVSLFFGPGQERLLLLLLCSFSGELHNGFKPRKAAVLYPASAEARAKQLKKRLDRDVIFISAAILQNDGVLAEELYRNNIEVLFLGYADEVKSSVLITLADLCSSKGIPIGIFSNVDQEPQEVALMELVDQCFLTAIANDSREVVFRDMRANVIEKVSLDGNRYADITASTAEELETAMKGAQKCPVISKEQQESSENLSRAAFLDLL